MKAHSFKQSSATAHPEPVTNDIVSEALAKQAKGRPDKPPITLPPPPRPPRVYKPKFRKHKK